VPFSHAFHCVPVKVGCRGPPGVHARVQHEQLACVVVFVFFHNCRLLTHGCFGSAFPLLSRCPGVEQDCGLGSYIVVWHVVVSLVT